MSLADDALGTAVYFANRPGRPPEQRLIDLLGLCARYRADLLGRRLLERDPRVRSGPFAGMLMPAAAEGCLAPKLLGCYEAELHQALAVAAWDAIVNIGCAEGYYAVGLARICASATLFAFDSDERAQAACRRAAEVNGVAERVRVAGALDPAGLEELLASLTGKVLLVCDIEGAEAALLDPAKVPSLARADLLVELHPMFVAGCDALLVERFAPTHELSRALQGARDPSDFAELAHLDQLDRQLAVWEFRPAGNDWLIAKAK